MRIRQTQVLLALVTTVFCAMAFSSTATDQTGDPVRFNVIGSTDESVMQQPLLLAKAEKVYVCHITPNGKYHTQQLPVETAQKLIDEHPHEWVLGKCDDMPSPS